MPGPDAQRIDLGPTGDDRLVAGFVCGATGFGVGVVCGAIIGSFAYAMTMWVAFTAVTTVLVVRRCGTVLDADGIHHRGLRRRTSVAWSAIDAARWGDWPRYHGEGSDVRLYVTPRSADHLTVLDVDSPGLVEPRTRLGHRKRRRFVAAVRMLQAHGVPVYADTLSRRSTMWALGLEPDER